MIIRPATKADLAPISALCMRSKAVWGYDPAFMEMCRDELTLHPADLETTSVAVGVENDALLAIAQVEVTDDTGELLKLYVEPTALQSGTGRAMFTWAIEEAIKHGASRLRIEADPNAVPFYERMGAVVTGTAPSGSIPGRDLPLLMIEPL